MFLIAGEETQALAKRLTEKLQDPKAVLAALGVIGVNCMALSLFGVHPRARTKSFAQMRVQVYKDLNRMEIEFEKQKKELENEETKEN